MFTPSHRSRSHRPQSCHVPLGILLGRLPNLRPEEQLRLSRIPTHDTHHTSHSHTPARPAASASAYLVLGGGGASLALDLGPTLAPRTPLSALQSPALPHQHRHRQSNENQHLEHPGPANQQTRISISKSKQQPLYPKPHARSLSLSAVTRSPASSSARAQSLHRSLRALARTRLRGERFWAIQPA